MKRKRMKNSNGFTLVELMITLFLTAIAVVAIYRGYTSFSQSADAQEQIIEMQQNLRIGMYMLEKDLRRAGMNEEEDDTAGFIVADTNTVEFTMDLGGATLNAFDDITPCTGNPEGDGDVLDSCERISYGRKDPNGDGIFGLYRNDEILNPTGIGNEIITNLDALDFVYLTESGSAMNALPLTENDRKRIRSVQVSMVVRTTNEDYRYSNSEPYENIRPLTSGGPQVIFTGGGEDDHFRRRVLSKQIKIRNAGL
jgi:prepilin-type N-terminal cleavage/methylation domain-containing protein